MTGSPLQFLAAALLFYAAFDTGFDASYSRGDGHAIVEIDRYAPVLTSGGRGRFGEAASFVYGDKQDDIWTKDVIRYKAVGNFPSGGVAVDNGAIGMWLMIDMDSLLTRSLIWLDPVHLLGPGNEGRGKIWMDFVTKELPGAPVFRFGATRSKEEADETGGKEDDHVIVIPGIDFTGGEWHHIVGVWSGLDGRKGAGLVRLYFDGLSVGEIKGFDHRLVWDMTQVEIRIGLGFKGIIDEFFIMNRCLSDKEVAALYHLDKPLGTIVPEMR